MALAARTHHPTSSWRRLALGGSLLAAMLATSGCEDPPPTALQPGRQVAEAAAWGPLEGTLAPSEPTAWESGSAGDAESGFEIDELTASHERLAGPERFFVTVRVVAPLGEHAKAYGLKTPYEEGIHAFSALPMAMRDGLMRIKIDPFATVPHNGKYPYEFWLINNRNEASNRLRGEVVLQ